MVIELVFLLAWGIVIGGGALGALGLYRAAASYLRRRPRFLADRQAELWYQAKCNAIDEARRQLRRET